ncbi:protein 5NUC-like [Contarinia nasturtii]|uniref:protein 5NUC-like n=1 Tax=Contarinia nasturtii TaxID=265458 RepID=UPI0012D4BEC0|nr:protein 5NUC-like [Contarinia nasturtii]
MFVYYRLSIDVVVFALLSSSCVLTLPIENESLDLIILHNNDMHAHFEQSDASTGKCQTYDAQANKCYGGFARVSHLVKAFRAEAETGGPPVLYLNAGDTYAGTPWFSIFKHKISSEFMNILKPDAMSLGNHEFDLGVEGLEPFLKEVKFPVLAANINNKDDHPLWQTGSLKKCIVFNVEGHKVGVIGYLTPETKSLAMKNDVEFISEIDAINKEAEALNNVGVKIIIALGHSGYEVDKQIAKNCPLVDVVVGGHTHTFLYSGWQPDIEKIEGPYPTIVVQDSGKKVPVVQAYAFTKYMGILRLKFDDGGNVMSWSGQPILLDSTIPQDPEVVELENVYRPQVEEILEKVIGVTKVRLDGWSCRITECNVGNLITDAVVNTRIRQHIGADLTDAPIALVASGDIRASAKIGNLTQFDLGTILPYENRLVVVNITGYMLRQVLEHSVKRYTEVSPPGEFLQVSGLRVVYNITRTSCNRVESIKVLCSSCQVPIYQDLEPNHVYGVIVSSFVYEGGDGFTMFHGLQSNYLNTTIQEAVLSYIQKTGVVYPSVMGRIQVYKN